MVEIPIINISQEQADLENRLNTYLGGQLLQHGVTTSNMEANADQIQAFAKIIAVQYDMADQAKKNALESAGFIKDKTARDGTVVGKEFNADPLFDLAREIDESLPLEEKSHLLADKVWQAITHFNDNQNDQATRIEISPESVHATCDVIRQNKREQKGIDYGAPPGATTSIHINVINKAIDPVLGKLGDAILPAHLAIRSGLSRSIANTPDQGAANGAYDSNFEKGAHDRDPSHIKTLMEAAQRLNAIERGASQEVINPADIKTVSDGLKVAEDEVRTIAQGHANADVQRGLTGLADDLGRLHQLYQPYIPSNPELNLEQAPTATQQTGGAGIAASEEPENPTMRERLKRMWKGRSYVPPEEIERMKSGFTEKQLAYYNWYKEQLGEDFDEEAIVHTLFLERGAANNKIPAPNEPQSILKSDEQNSLNLDIKQGAINFIPRKRNETLSYADAFEMAEKIVFDKKMRRNGVNITGTPKERARLQYAIAEINRSLPRGQKIKVREGKLTTKAYSEAYRLMGAEMRAASYRWRNRTNFKRKDRHKPARQANPNPPPPPPEDRNNGRDGNGPEPARRMADIPGHGIASNFVDTSGHEAPPTRQEPVRRTIDTTAHPDNGTAENVNLTTEAGDRNDTVTQEIRPTDITDNGTDRRERTLDHADHVATDFRHAENAAVETITQQAADEITVKILEDDTFDKKTIPTSLSGHGLTGTEQHDIHQEALQRAEIESGRQSLSSLSSLPPEEARDIIKQINTADNDRDVHLLLADKDLSGIQKHDLKLLAEKNPNAKYPKAKREGPSNSPSIVVA